MLNLIIKDFLIQKKMIGFSLLYVLVMMLAFQTSSGEAMMPAGAVALAYVLTMGACAYDDKNKTDIMLNSLPIKKSSIVLARYILPYFSMVLGIAEYFVVNEAIKLSGLPLHTYDVTASGILATLMAVTFIHCLYYPVFFKVGYIKAKLFNMIIFFGVFATVGGFAMIAQNSASVPFLNDLAKGLEQQSAMQISLLTLGIMLVMLALSFLLSLMFYRKREF